MLATMITVILFGLNFTPTMRAQTMEIEVTGGGYRIKGPEQIELSSVQASFNEELSYADIRTPDAPNQLTYLEITDENGGSSFNLYVDAENFNGAATISKNNLYVKNCDRLLTYSNPACLTTVEGSRDWVDLDPLSNEYVSLQSSIPLLQGYGQAPGKWRIYPSFRLNIPQRTEIGRYTTTVTFTIT